MLISAIELGQINYQGVIVTQRGGMEAGLDWKAGKEKRNRWIDVNIGKEEEREAATQRKCESSSFRSR